MLCVKPLLVLLLVVDDSCSSYVIHNLSCLCVKQVVAAVVTTVTAMKKNSIDVNISNNNNDKSEVCLFGTGVFVLHSQASCPKLTGKSVEKHYVPIKCKAIITEEQIRK